MATRDQDRAAMAYGHVSQYANQDTDDRAKKYASMVYKMPALLQSAGLCQAMHFVNSRNDPDQKRVVEHFAQQLRRVNPAITTADQLLERARNAPLAEYLRLTDEALACAAWYRRLVQGVLKIEASDAEGN